MANDEKLKPGPTGDFPHGKLSDDDEGGINVAISNHVAPDGEVMVRLDFGKPVAWLSLPSEQAIKFALTILRRASLRGVIVVGDEVDAKDMGRRGQSDSEVQS